MQTPDPTPPTKTQINTAKAQEKPSDQTAHVAWEEFLEDDADCCGGCHHKPR